MLLRGSIAAALLLVATGVSAQTGRTAMPGGAAPMTAGYFDAAYARSESRQHLGFDFRMNAGSTVYAPIEGDVVTNNTSASDVMQAYLVIRAADGSEHVLGHISSSLRRGQHVLPGAPVGTVRTWPGNSHVHHGVNRRGIAQAMSGSWGWGRAPVTATRAQAAERGWVDRW